MSDFQAIKDRISLVEYVSKRYQAKPIGSGKIRINPCPVCSHNDSFTVFENTQSFYCFSCGAGGNIFDFLISTKEAGDHYDALKKLASEVGYELKKTTRKEYDRSRVIQDIFDTTSDFYKNQLNDQAREYLANQRKRTPEMIEKARYGFANGQSLYDHLIQKGFKKDDILASGLVRNKDNRIYDLFQNNLFIYPITYYNKICDFFSKDYFEQNKSKRRNYQLTKDNKINNVLFYGQEAIFKREFIIVEGPEDRLTVMEHSDMPVVAILGQLSKEQLDFIENHAGDATVYMAFDPDAAGRKYSRQLINRMAGKAFLKQLVWEGDSDIDDYLKSQFDPENELDHLIKTAEDAVIHEIENLSIRDTDPRELERIINPVIKWIAAEEKEFVRINYIDLLGARIVQKDDGSPGTKEDLKKYLPAIKKLVNRELGIQTSIGDQEKEETDYGIIEKSGRYYFITQKSDSLKLTNFILRIKQMIEEEDEMYYEVQLKNDKGFYSQKFLLAAEEQVNFRKFKVACKKRGQYHFFGDDHHLSEVIQKEEDRAGEIPFTRYYRRYGWIEKQNLWLFHNCAIREGKIYPADENGSIEIDGIGYCTKNVNIYGNDKPTINTEFKVTKDYLINILEHFWTMWDHREGEEPVSIKKKTKAYRSFKGFMAFAYIAAMAYRPEWIRFDRKFPNLFGYGPVRTGKSEAIQLMMNAFGWHHEGNVWKASTIVGISYSLEHLSSLPLWMEEYSNTSSKDPKQEGKIELIRGAYNMSSPVKGNLNRQTISNEVNTNFVITGQDYLTDKAAQTRTISLRKEKPTEEGSKSYFYLKNEKENLSAIFLWLIKNKTKESIKELFDNFHECKSYLKQRIKDAGGDVDDRTLVNYSIIMASFGQFDIHEYDQEFADWVINEIVGARERQNEADIIHQFFSDIEVIYQGDDITTVVDIEDRIVYLRIHQIYNDWKINSNRLDQREHISEAVLRDYLRLAPEGYWCDMGKDHRHLFRDIDKSGNFEINRKRYQAIGLYIDKLPADIKDIVESWL